MNYYELVGLIPGNLAENEVEPILQEVSDIIKNTGANIKRSEIITRRKTAYTIEKMRHAYYFVISFEHEGGLGEAEKKLKLHKNLLRFLITKTKPKTEEEIAKEKIRFQKQGDGEEQIEIKERRDKKTQPFKIERKTLPENQEKKEDKKEKETKEPSEPVNIEQLDKKIDEILDEEIK